VTVFYRYDSAPGARCQARQCRGPRMHRKRRKNMRSREDRMGKVSLARLGQLSFRRPSRAAQGLALGASEPRASHLQGYTDLVRSAKLPTGVNNIGSSSVLVMMKKTAMFSINRLH
jgi:hypothetical protein